MTMYGTIFLGYLKSNMALVAMSNTRNGISTLCSKELAVIRFVCTTITRLPQLQVRDMVLPNTLLTTIGLGTTTMQMPNIQGLPQLRATTTLKHRLSIYV